MRKLRDKSLVELAKTKLILEIRVLQLQLKKLKAQHWESFEDRYVKK